MKKYPATIFTTLLVALFLGTLGFAAYKRTSGGGIATAVPAVASVGWAGDYCWELSLVNTNASGSTVFFEINCGTSELATAMAATNGRPLPAGVAISVQAPKTTKITNFCFMTVSGTTPFFYAPTK